MAISNNSTGLRPGVCTSTTRPTAPYEGQTIYETDTDLTYVWGGSAWQQVSGGTAVGNSGLVYITSTSLSGSSVSVANCFNSTYENYLILANNLVTAANCTLLMQFATGSTDTSANYGRQRLYVQLAAVGGTGSTGNTSIGVGFGVASNENFLTIQVSQPNLARKTFTISQENYQDTLQANIEYNHGLLSTTTQYTGFVLTASGTTFTSGTLRIYGYRQA